jgi:hypothetical protein
MNSQIVGTLFVPLLQFCVVLALLLEVMLCHGSKLFNLIHWLLSCWFCFKPTWRFQLLLVVIYFRSSLLGSSLRWYSSTCFNQRLHFRFLDWSFWADYGRSGFLQYVLFSRC